MAVTSIRGHPRHPRLYPARFLQQTPPWPICGSVRDVALLPEQLQRRTAIPNTRSSPDRQPLPLSRVLFFPGLSTGTYTFQMTDACAKQLLPQHYYRHAGRAQCSPLPAAPAPAAPLPSPSRPSPFLQLQLAAPPTAAPAPGIRLPSNLSRPQTRGTYNITVTSTIGGCTSTKQQERDAGLFARYCRKPCCISAVNKKTATSSLTGRLPTRTGHRLLYCRAKPGWPLVSPPCNRKRPTRPQNTYTAIDTHVPSGRGILQVANGGKQRDNQL